jgi:hypothetical protein
MGEGFPEIKVIAFGKFAIITSVVPDNPDDREGICCCEGLLALYSANNPS